MPYSILRTKLCVIFMMTMLGIVGLPVAAVAQTPAVWPRIELGVGGRWEATMPIVTGPATLTSTRGGRYELFGASTEWRRALFFDGRIGVRLWKRLRAEGAVGYGEAPLTTMVTGDAEAGSGQATERVRRWLVEGRVAVDLRGPGPGRHLVPFVGAGGGHARFVHQGRTLVERGQTVFADAGLQLLLSQPVGTAAKAFGVRFDGRLSAGRGGLLPKGQTTLVPGIGFSVFVRY
jgi:hypothetical protein